MSRPLSVTISAVLVLLGSLLTLLMAALMGLAMSMALPGAAAQPPFMRQMMVSMAALFVGLGIWGIATAVGLFRMKRWARASMLLFSGGLVFFAACSFLPLFFMPFFAPPDVPNTVIRGVIVGMGLFYGILLLIGIWWLVLFNRATIKAEFLGAEYAEPPRLPLSITVIAWYLLSICVCFPFMIPMNFPACILGLVVAGWPAKLFYLANGVVSAFAGYGLLKRKTWAYSWTLGFFGFGVLSALIFCVLPNSHQKLEEFSRAMLPPEMRADALPTPPIWSGVVVGVLTCGLPVYFLLTRKKRYLEACRAAASASGPEAPG